MKQRRIDSLMESVVNVIIGLVISTIANWLILPPLLGVELDLGTNVLIGVIFTIISIARSYTLRRLFNGKSIWMEFQCWRAYRQTLKMKAVL